MPRYHFDLVDSKTVADQGGQILEDGSMAIQVADRLAQELSEARPELHGRGYKVLVTDADGEHVHEAPLDKFKLIYGSGVTWHLMQASSSRESELHS